jgi:hypothetical protein
MSASVKRESEILCRILRNSPDGPEILCQVSKERTHALVLSLIGALFLSTGLYLFLSGIGTLASVTAGCFLFIGGVGFLFGALMMIRKSLCSCNENNLISN